MKVGSPAAHSANAAAAETYCSAVDKMLDVNQTLELLDLLVYAPPAVSYLARIDIMRHNQESIPVVGTALPLACRLAFLNIFTATERGQDRVSKRV